PSPDDAPAAPSPGNAPAAPPPTPPAAPPPTPPAAPPPAAAPPAPPASAPANPASDDSAPAAEDNGKTEVITVTDSPVEHELFTGRAPVSVVTRADLAASGHATLGDILQALPAQANAGNAQ